MKKGVLQKSSKRNAAVRKHLNSFRSGFDKVTELLVQSQDYITELEKELQQTKQENKALTLELKRLRGQGYFYAERRRAGSTDEIPPRLLRTRSLDDTFRKAVSAPNSANLGSRAKTIKESSGSSSKVRACIPACALNEQTNERKCASVVQPKH